MRRLLRSVLLGLALAAAGAGAPPPAAAAQDTVPPRPAPRDTLRRPPRDTARVGIPAEAVRGDTLPDAVAGQDTAPPDSTIPAPSLIAHPLAPAHGFSDAAWLLGPAELGHFHGLSLADLLDGVPGLGITRSGSFGRPLAVSPFFAGGGRLRVFLDGYELRAMNGASPDLQRIPIVNLESVRIQRGAHEVRVDLTSFRLADIRPYARIEAMDGDYDSRALRGMFTRPFGRRLVGEVALDLEETDGFLRREPYSASHAVARLSYAVTPQLGVQLEYRRSSVDAGQQTGGAATGLESYDRREAILRARGRFLGRVDLEATLGRSTQAPAGDDSVTFDARSLQAGVRAALQAGFGLLSGGARVHRSDDDGWGPDATELWGRLDFAPAPWLAATGEVRSLTMGGVSGVETEATLRAGPRGGISLFGSVAAGTRGIRFLYDTVAVRGSIGGIVGLPGVPTLDTVDVSVFRTADVGVTALRAGAELARGGLRLGAAFVTHDADAITPFGFVRDRGAAPAGGGSISGVEGYALLPVWLVPGLRVEGWYQRWLGDAERPFLPTQLGRAALEYSRVLKEGNLEPVIRLEVVGRDEAIAPDPATGQPALTERYAMVNAYVQVRILDVRIFWRFDNLLNQRGRSDVPGTVLPGGRALYGVRWFFRN